MEEGPVFRVDAFDRSRLVLAAAEGATLRVIEVRAGSLATGASSERAPGSLHGAAVPDVSRDLLKLAVVERHRGTGNVGVAFARGFGLKRGAVASSVAHDSHNVVVVGADDASMETAVRRVAAIGGGIVVSDGAQVLAEVALPVGGPHVQRPDGRRRRRRAPRERGRRDARRHDGPPVHDARLPRAPRDPGAEAHGQGARGRPEVRLRAARG